MSTSVHPATEEDAVTNASIPKEATNAAALPGFVWRKMAEHVTV